MTDGFDRGSAKRSLRETMDDLLDGLDPPADASDP
jgi:hypothetical protein